MNINWNAFSTCLIFTMIIGVVTLAIYSEGDLTKQTTMIIGSWATGLWTGALTNWIKW